jgi:AAA ATPase domain
MTREEKAAVLAALVGRDRELAFVGAFLDRAAAGGALLLTGDPGVGKTMLLDVAAARAEAAGTRVLRVAGAEFGGQANYSALSDLLRPVLETGGARALRTVILALS